MKKNYILFITTHTDSHRETHMGSGPSLMTGVTLALLVATTGLTKGGLCHSLYLFQQISTQIRDNIQESISALLIQKQLTSTAFMDLHNWRVLDLMTDKKGGIHLFLSNVFTIVNQSGLVEDELKFPCWNAEYDPWEMTLVQNSYYVFWGGSWHMPFLGPLISILLILMVAPCLFRLFQERMNALTWWLVNQILLMEFPSNTDSWLEVLFWTTIPDPSFWHPFISISRWRTTIYLYHQQKKGYITIWVPKCQWWW